MGTTRPLPDQRGFTLIDMLFVIALVGLLSTLALPGMMRARGAAQSSSALGTMRAINSGQLSYAITCGLGFYAPDLPTLGVRPPASTDGFLPDGLTGSATIIRHGYTFTVAGTPLVGAPATCNGLGPNQAAPGYTTVANPIDTAATTRFFGTNSDGIIYEHDATMDGIMPETGLPLVGSPIR
ncbi:MAG TPA: type II secretion system protein [Vicinamibacterales bacterium]|nr:type II secretion system protein [Vicinamibacterales bacterium]